MKQSTQTQHASVKHEAINGDPNLPHGRFVGRVLLDAFSHLRVSENEGPPIV